jgi:hydrophobic/amphiphilic exporter-1 (mainly G- bacteria), HAE1 family
MIQRTLGSAFLSLCGAFLLTAGAAGQTTSTAPSQEMNELDKVISTITGVAEINIQGAHKMRAVCIKYDFDALASRGISVEEIRQVVDPPPRMNAADGVDLGFPSTAAFFKQVIVAWRNGAPVRLEDIAKVEEGPC